MGALAVLVVLLSVVTLVLLFVYLPFSMYTQAECLRKGYPKYAVTVGLERYCMNLEGTITVRVEQLSK